MKAESQLSDAATRTGALIEQHSLSDIESRSHGKLYKLYIKLLLSARRTTDGRGEERFRALLDPTQALFPTTLAPQDPVEISMIVKFIHIPPLHQLGLMRLYVTKVLYL